ncbi:soluble calcium-activated nucleotidase 1-like isoform X4 [Branchiostoma lanceolatum]|uniref:soluble calcium-activated nucleotidase 1-like isoform X4 n=1 Tax=Branchiostoma lanceolatum TaxID=7740 RepID=UPI00345253D2
MRRKVRQHAGPATTSAARRYGRKAWEKHQAADSTEDDTTANGESLVDGEVSKTKRASGSYQTTSTSTMEGRVKEDKMISIKTVTSPIRPVEANGIRLRFRMKVILAVVAFVAVILFFYPSCKSTTYPTDRFGQHTAYNSTYPMTAPWFSERGTHYRIGLITDLDHASKNDEKTWKSFYKKGVLVIKGDRVQVTWDDAQPTVMTSSLAQGGRSMELSELCVFNGRLYSVDDRTGVVYEIVQTGDKTVAVPWVILGDGNGRSTNKGFKGEWVAVKDDTMYVGGLGKEWTTTTGVVLNTNPQFVKTIGFHGDVAHHDWVGNYNAMREAAGYSYPGYMIHESGVWSDIHQRWFFLPRRASQFSYNEDDDEHRATNLIISCSEDFQDIKVQTIGKLNPIRGFSSFKFIPGTQDQVMVALKTEEDRGAIATFISVFRVDGKILLTDQRIEGDFKYEGVEFI